MMKMLKKLQQNNKGISLMEVLVSVAVSMIVMVVAATFIATSTNFFNKQSGSINLQNELLECSNKYTDTLMEASYLKISNSADGGLVVYTGEPDIAEEYFVTGKGVAKRLEWNKSDNTLYALNYPTLPAGDDKQGYLIGSYVSDVKVSIQEECTIVQSDGVTLNFEQPLIIKVEMKVSDGKETRSDSKTITLRNNIDKLVLYGTTYVNVSGILIPETMVGP